MIISILHICSYPRKVEAELVYGFKLYVIIKHLSQYRDLPFELFTIVTSKTGKKTKGMMHRHLA